MIDVCLLGTGGMMPLPHRFLTSLMLRYCGQSILIDCGEATQIALRKKGWSPNPVDIICLTHFHADHVSGLPGFLLTMGNSERTKPLQIIGPSGLKRVVEGLRVIAPDLPFKINLREIAGNGERFAFDGFFIDAFKVNHNIECFGYSFSVPRKGRFDVERANAQGIPQKLWSSLQKGESVEANGRIFTPNMVLGEQRRGLKVTYTTDTRPCQSIIDSAKGADLFICEGMYGSREEGANAKKFKHMMFHEAAELARGADVKKLWLTHYSPVMLKPQEYLDEVRMIFPETYTAKDGYTTQLTFDEDS